MPIPLSLVGFADAFDPWPSYRNHPVVRTRLAGGMHPADPSRWGVLRVGSGMRRGERGRQVFLRATSRM